MTDGRRVIVIGGGGHAGVVVDVLSAAGIHRVFGVTDADSSRRGTLVAGAPVLGDDRVLDELSPTDYVVIMAVGDNRARANLFDAFARRGFDIITAIHPSATLGSDVGLGRGVVVAPQCAVNHGSRIGDNVILNTSASIDHDCLIADHVHVGPGCRLAGRVQVGEGAQISLGAVVVPDVTIGAWSVVGAGSVVLQDVPPETLVAGVPARHVRNLT